MTHTTFTLTTITFTGATEEITVKASFEYSTCAIAESCKNNNRCLETYIQALQQTFDGRGLTVKLDKSSIRAKILNCQRRLTAFRDPESRRLSAPTLELSTQATVPAGQAAQQQTGIDNTPTADVQSNAVAALQSQSMSNLAPTGTASLSAVTLTVPPGFSKCFQGAGCYFKVYKENKHYKIHETGAGMSKASCAAACRADNDCEAFESMGNGKAPSCSFWMNGACNLAGSKNPDGYANSVSGAETCEKIGDRKAYEPDYSKSGGSCTLSTLSAFFMVGVMVMQ